VGRTGNLEQVALFINARMNQMDMELRKEAAIHKIMSAGRTISVILPKPIATIVFDEILVSGKEQAFRVRPRLFDSRVVKEAKALCRRSMRRRTLCTGVALR
jgi:hypothetical protein